MSLTGFLRSDFLSSIWTPLRTQLRYRNRPNLKRPLPLHYNRARMVAVTKPIYPEPVRVCDNLDLSVGDKDIEKVQEHAYAQYLARRLIHNFNIHPMIAIFHVNPLSELDYLNTLGMLFDAGFKMKITKKSNSNVARAALTGTKFEPALQLFVSQTALGYCSTVDVPKLLKVVKKMPQYVLIGLILENRLLHRADIERVAEMTDLTSVRASLCHTLQMGAANISRTLLANQVALSTSLTTLSSGETEQK